MDDEKQGLALEAIGYGSLPWLRDVPRDVLARVRAEHRIDYELISERGEVRAAITGKLRLAIERGEAEAPAVGDWVRVSGDEGDIILETFPRRTKIARKQAGKRVAEQVLAANVDVVIIACALTQEIRPRRLERALSVVRDGGAKPVIVLTKADAYGDPAAHIAELEAVSRGAPVHAVSAATGEGVLDLERYFEGGATVVLVGASGVGKSTLLNRWLGADVQTTQAVRAGDDKGRHTTTSRQLFVRPRGGVVIDTPGIRELGLWDAEEGVTETFEEIEALAETCRFGNCSHKSEPGCAIEAARASGAIDAARIESFLALKRETRAVADDAQSRAVKKGREKTMTRALKRT